VGPHPSSFLLKAKWVACWWWFVWWDESQRWNCRCDGSSLHRYRHQQRCVASKLSNTAAPPVVAVLELGRTHQISSASNDLCDNLANCDCALNCRSDAAFCTPAVQDPVKYLLLKTVPRLQQQVFFCGGCLCGQKMNLNLLVDQQRFLQALLKAEYIGKRVQFIRGVAAGLAVATRAAASMERVLNEGAARMEATAINIERDLLHYETRGNFHNLTKRHQNPTSTKHSCQDQEDRKDRHESRWIKCDYNHHRALS